MEGGCLRPDRQIHPRLVFAIAISCTDGVPIADMHIGLFRFLFANVRLRALGLAFVHSSTHSPRVEIVSGGLHTCWLDAICT